MTGKTHAAVGTALALPFVELHNPATYLLIPVALFGALVPDIDADYYLLGTIKYIFLFVAVALVFLLTSESNMSFIAVFVLCAALFVFSKTQHRTIMHSLLGMVIFSVIVFIIRPAILPAFVVGYGSHLLMDSITVSGVPLLYPRQRIYGIRKVYNKGNFDYFIRGLSVLIIISMVLLALS
jgi:inner membrane protein